jgi:hypothetical protein
MDVYAANHFGERVTMFAPRVGETAENRALLDEILERGPTSK